MKSGKIFDGITHIKDEFIEEAATHKFKKKRKLWPAVVAAVLVISIGIGTLLPGSTPTAYAISEAVYPQAAAYPNIDDYMVGNEDFDHDAFVEAYEKWNSDYEARLDHEAYSDGLTAFLSNSAGAVLGSSTQENPAYSPISLYLALGMLAELTDGTSRQQILDALGEDDLEALRRQANTLWNANYSNDGILTTIPASSLWLDEGIEYNAATMDTLAESYYASSYQGTMGSGELNKLLQSWLNDQTGGLLEEQANSQSFDAQTVLALATTVYFKGKWVDPFSEEKTTQETFHTPQGDVTADFMHSRGTKAYYWADQFGAVGIPMESGAVMWLLLPDEGVTPEALLEDPQTMEFILSGYNWENAKDLVVNLSLPKFDVVSEMDLKDGMQALGITDVFDETAADFSAAMEDGRQVYLDKASHAARVTIDEEGCTAAAVTIMQAPGASPPPDEIIDFTLDRPFLFAITSADNMPLFIGIVNEP